MDNALREIARHHAYGTLGLEPDPALGFAGVRALRELTDFCENHQVRHARAAGQPSPPGQVSARRHSTRNILSHLNHLTLRRSSEPQLLWVPPLPGVWGTGQSVTV